MSSVRAELIYRGRRPVTLALRRRTATMRAYGFLVFAAVLAATLANVRTKGKVVVEKVGLRHKSPPHPFNPIDYGICGPDTLKATCPKVCSYEWNPVIAYCEDVKAPVRFMNCCGWHQEVCIYNRPCKFLHRDKYVPCFYNWREWWNV